MKIVVLIARLLLGLSFFVFGLNGFLMFLPGAPPPGPATEFVTAMSVSHYAYLVFGVQFIAGVLLLTNQYVPLALLMLAAVIANILAFHVTMAPASIPPAIFVLILWFVVSWSFRAEFAPILARKPVLD